MTGGVPASPFFIMDIKRTVFLILSLTAFLSGYMQDSRIDSLRAIVSSSEDDSRKVQALIELSERYYRSAPSEAIRYGNEARDLAEMLDDRTHLAYALKSIGMGYYFQGDYVETLIFWRQSLEAFKEAGDKLGEANMLNNLGAVHFNGGDDSKAIEYYLESLRVSEEIGDKLRIATALVNIGAVYFNKEVTYDLAQKYYLRALPLSIEVGDYDAIGTSAVNLGELYLEQNILDSALMYFERAMSAYHLADQGNIPYALNNIGKVYAKRGAFDEAIRYQKEAYDMAERLTTRLEMAQSLIGLADTYDMQGNVRLAIDAYKRARSMAEELGANNELEDIYIGLATNYAELSAYDSAYKYKTLHTAIRDTLFNAEMTKRIQNMSLNMEIESQQSQISLLTKDKELQEARLQKQRLAKNAFMAGLILIFIIAFVIYRNYRNKARVSRILDRQKMEIEKLLLNILPGEVAKELQESGVATPRHFDSVSILFTDFKGFSSIAEGLSPNELVTELNEFFMAFDDIAERFNMEKIKTIGDAYMCAGGIPVADDNHALNAVRAGLAMQEFMKMNNKKRMEQGKMPWALRVGIHTGPVVAGVVGRKKYAYDIWGSSVNISSRMESNGEAGKLNISITTYDLVKDHYLCTHRGKLYAKNIGDIDMYFVAQEKVREVKGQPFLAMN